MFSDIGVDLTICISLELMHILVNNKNDCLCKCILLIRILNVSVALVIKYSSLYCWFIVIIAPNAFSLSADCITTGSLNIIMFMLSFIFSLPFVILNTLHLS